jgi:hypothetical protein
MLDRILIALTTACVMVLLSVAAFFVVLWLETSVLGW